MEIIGEPPWVVEIEGVKFAAPELVCLLLKDVSEERDELKARLEATLLPPEHSWVPPDAVEEPK